MPRAEMYVDGSIDSLDSFDLAQFSKSLTPGRSRVNAIDSARCIVRPTLDGVLVLHPILVGLFGREVESSPLLDVCERLLASPTAPLKEYNCRKRR